MEFKTVFCYVLFLTAGFAANGQEQLMAPGNMTLIPVSPLALLVQFIDTNTEEDTYVIYHSTSPDGPFYEEWVISGTPDAGEPRDFIFGFYEPLTTVYVKVIAVDLDEGGNILAYGIPSELLSATTLEFYQAQPTDFVARSEGNHLRLTWTDTTPAGSVGDEFIFRMYRASDGGVNYNRMYTFPANTTSFVDKEVEPNTVYKYRLDAENQYGVSGEFLMNFTTASLKRPETLVYPNPAGSGIVTVNLDNEYNKGTVHVVVFQAVSGEYYSTDVVLHGSKFTLDAFTLLPAGSAYHLIMTLPDGSVVTGYVWN